MRFTIALALAAALGGPAAIAQSNFPPEEFTAVAVANNNIASGIQRVQIRVNRWSSEAERDQLVNALVKDGSDGLMKALTHTKAVGRINTPDSLGYDLHFAYQRPGEDGGRDVVIATDRPIGFWEASHQPRTIDYPFTVIQMHMDKEGNGKGTLSYATKIRVVDKTIELENFATSPVMLTEIKSEPRN